MARCSTTTPGVPQVPAVSTSTTVLSQVEASLVENVMLTIGGRSASVQVAWPPATASVAVAMGAADGLLLPAWSVLTARNSYVPAVSSDASNCAHHSVVATLPLASIRTALRPIIRACCG